VAGKACAQVKQKSAQKILTAGALFETFRNNAAGLRTRQRQDLDIDPVTHKVIVAKLIRNEYGGWASGPVIKNSVALRMRTGKSAPRRSSSRLPAIQELFQQNRCGDQ
jgi:hypothetical protein